MLGCQSVSAISLLDPTDHDDNTISRNVGDKLTGPNLPEKHYLQKHCSESLKCLCVCLVQGAGEGEVVVA